MLHGQLVRDVQLSHVRVEPSVLRVFFFQHLHLVAELPVATCYQDAPTRLFL